VAASAASRCFGVRPKQLEMIRDALRHREAYFRLAAARNPLPPPPATSEAGSSRRSSSGSRRVRAGAAPPPVFASSGSLTLSQGHLNLDASATQSADALSTQTAGDYRKLRFALSRQQALGDDLTLGLSFSGQWTDQNLDPSEKFFLGGSTGVRA